MIFMTSWGRIYPIILTTGTGKKSVYFLLARRVKLGKKNEDRVLILGPGETRVVYCLFVCVCCENPWAPWHGFVIYTPCSFRFDYMQELWVISSKMHGYRWRDDLSYHTTSIILTQWQYHACLRKYSIIILNTKMDQVEVIT